MKAKKLKTEADYEAALAYIETLMDAAPGSPAEEELSLFALLVEQYEREHYPIAPPDPIDAILFRMDQEGLRRADLVPYIGSQSKVSEVLSRKRPLSITMIRNLHAGLGIPAATLLQSPGKALAPAIYNPQDYPIKEMLERGYFGEWNGKLRETKLYAEELLEKFFAVFGSTTPQPVFCRRTESAVDDYALRVWQARVLHMIQGKALPRYEPGTLDEAFFKRIARASYFPHGPTLVESLLNERGIHFVLLEHLPQTYLDGACFISPQGEPVIAMTLRHDRLDNFWFTLAHELGHLHLHLPNDDLAFFDDTERDLYSAKEPSEVAANTFARDIYISPDQWRIHASALIETGEDSDVIALAELLEISPAIVAGRIRWESGNYTRFAKLVNSGRVRDLFPDVKKC
jgi:HTH-type transcriptional regulator/antitoxin HigA